MSIHYNVNDKYPDADEQHSLICDNGDYVNEHLAEAEKAVREKLSNNNRAVALKILAKLRHMLLEKGVDR